MLRGMMHFYSALSSPLWSGYQLSLCHTAQETWAVLLACSGATCMLGASGGYHYPSWQTEAQEVLMGKFDYGAIYLQIAFSAAPMYLLLLPAPINWAVIGSMAVCAACGVFLTFGPIGHLGRHAGALVYIVMGAVQVLPLLTCLLSERTMWSQLLPLEQNLLISLAAAYLVGSHIYANATPRLWSATFGFHELWHLLVVIGSASSWAVNCSLLQRREALLYYTSASL
jgi:hemolysin III